MDRPRILVTTPYLSEDAMGILASVSDRIEMTPYPSSEDEVKEAIAQLDPHAILSRTYPIGAEAIAAAPALRVISKHGTGVDNIDLDAARARGIVVTNCFGVNSPAVAEHALALMLALAKNVARHDREVRQGTWSRFAFKANMLEGQILGLVGFGEVARRLSEIAAVLGMGVIAWGPRLTPQAAPAGVRVVPDLDDLLAQADIVSLHCPATPQTRHLIDARALARMKPGAWLINTARGSVVDEAALISALKAGTLGAAALDCLESEPPRPDNPLLSMETVVVTPHVGGATLQSTYRVGLRAAENLVAALEGKPIDPRAVVVGR